MTLKRRIERAEQSYPDDKYAGWTDEQLTSELARRTADWTETDWEESWNFARQNGWSEQRISKARNQLGV